MCIRDRSKKHTPAHRTLKDYSPLADSTLSSLDRALQTIDVVHTPAVGVVQVGTRKAPADEVFTVQEDTLSRTEGTRSLRLRGNAGSGDADAASWDNQAWEGENSAPPPPVPIPPHW
eukprot:TRINITY_DN2850_c0_g1_i1.p2 TRINITY_DN2850_c0_g1~~TRINITY_DN2850_c0_g1_i1.p2  ORF type:complete len:117 (+),score=15.58 TRINITY_DN2850_c0_g1_i1:83-433(+)